jgi:hypothetical protein
MEDSIKTLDGALSAYEREALLRSEVLALQKQELEARAKENTPARISAWDEDHSLRTTALRLEAAFHAREPVRFRENLATAAMNGILVAHPDVDAKALASRSVEIADAMFSALRQPGQP